MTLHETAAIFGILILAVIFILIFGQAPVFKGSFVRALHTLITVDVIDLANRLLQWTLGSQVQRISQYCGWISNEKHSMVQIFYLVLVLGGFGAHLATTQKSIPNPNLPYYHTYLSPIILILTLTAFVVASFSNPGRIDSHNVEKVERLYDYDYIMFTRKECNTCKFSK